MNKFSVSLNRMKCFMWIFQEQTMSVIDVYSEQQKQDGTLLQKTNGDLVRNKLLIYGCVTLWQT